MSMMYKCPNCDHTFHMWTCLSHVATLVTCPHTCNMWSNLSNMVTLSTWLVTFSSKCQWYGHTFHVRSPLSHIVTLVTCGHTCHMWSHISDVVTIVTCGQNWHMVSHCLYWETDVSIDFQKVHLLTPDETRPTCWPAQMQLKRWESVHKFVELIECNRKCIDQFIDHRS